MRSLPPARRIAVSSVAIASLALAGVAALLGTVPTEIQQPGTQPGEIGNLGGTPTNCDNCHGSYDAAVEPAFQWRGSAMAHAGRDPLFWATMAIAEQDFPGSGDLCLRCHAPRGWLEGRSTPTDGSGLAVGDDDGVECSLCHKLVNPDDSEHVGVQNPPFVANDGGTPAAGYYGSGMAVIWPGNERMGPYADAAANHPFLQSQFHRSPDLCGTCHDVSNPAVGDLAPGNGAQTPLPPGSYSGVLGAPVTAKAAFNNLPHRYGVVERTYSEFRAGAFDTLLVSAYASLPPELRAGAIEEARDAALLAGTGGNYADGTPRVFSCQTCHMKPAVGFGCDAGGPLRSDLPVHDLTGGSVWIPQAIQYLDGLGELPFGGSLTSGEITAMNAGSLRALHQLEEAASLSVVGNTLRLVNLTGHKLITGYPEGRRMWLRVRWFDGFGNLVRDDGAYGPLAVTLNGAPLLVETILDPDGPHTRIYEARFGLSQAWASDLVGLGFPASLPLAYDRATGAATITLGQLASQPPGSVHESFHFVLNNSIVKDTRIPPYGMSFDEAAARSVAPVPAAQYGNPGPGESYEHFDEFALDPPAGAATASVELLYQSTSWEYVQFLRLANAGTSPTLGQIGVQFLDAWLATGMAAPIVMASTVWEREATTAPLGIGCGGAGVPTLTGTPPVLGQILALGVSGATPLRPGFVLASAPPPSPFAYAPGCFAWVDVPGSIVLLLFATDGGGGASLALPVPATPSFAGASLVLQGVVVGTGGPLGLDATNGLSLTLGN